MYKLFSQKSAPKVQCVGRVTQVHNLFFERPYFLNHRQILKIYVHPLKSGRGLKVDSAVADIQGLNWNGLIDRSWCVRYAKNNIKGMGFLK